MSFLELIPGEYAFVAKVNVQDLDNSVKWYENLGMKEDPRYRVNTTWRQMNFPNMPRIAIGLNKSSDTGTDTSVATIVVNDITKARQYLVNKHVDVSPIQDYDGVKLCYFRDPDCNRLGLRQNPHGHPNAEKIGIC